MNRTIRIFLLLTVLGLTLPVNAGKLTVNVTNNKNEPLPDAVVYLTAAGMQPEVNTAAYEIEQRNKMFHPFVSIIPVGSKVMFPNRDGIGHHVYSFSPAKIFQLPLSEEISTDIITFDEPGIVTVGCNIHDWMVAYLYVVDSNLFGKTDNAGAVVLDGLPDGQYLLHATHPGIKPGPALTRQINIATGGDTVENFSLDIKPEYFWRPTPRTDEEEY